MVWLALAAMPGSDDRVRVGQLYIQVVKDRPYEKFYYVEVTPSDDDEYLIAAGDFDQAIKQVRDMVLDLSGVISALERLKRSRE